MEANKPTLVLTSVLVGYLWIGASFDWFVPVFVLIKTEQITPIF